MRTGKESTDFKNKVVLIVDPADNIRSTIASMLKQLGFAQIQQAARLSHANQIIAKQKVDIIISEQLPPEVDGLNLLRNIRSTEEMARCAFVIVSASLDQATVINAVKSGVSEFIVKPFSLKTFSERLQRAVALPVKSAQSSDAKDNSQAQPVESISDKELETTSILVVDDVPENIKVISEVIRSDYQVKAATSGEKALKICMSPNPPDLVLLDIMMPDMDGLTVCKKLKAHPATQHITVIFISAMDQTDDVVRGLELGAVDYITKPINPRILAARVKNHVKIARATKNLREQVDLMVDYTQLRSEFDRALQKDMKRPFESIADNLRKLDVYYDEPKKVRETSQQLKEICHSANNYMENLHLLTQLESNSYNFTPMNVNLADMVGDVTAQLDGMRKARNQKWQIDESSLLVIQAEESMVRMTLANLIKNAIEASNEGDTISIKFQSSNKKVQCIIHNPTMIDPAIRSRFYEKYVSWKKADGVGLGTYVAKLLTEAQNGRIWFETGEETGTSLFLEYPQK